MEFRRHNFKIDMAITLVVCCCLERLLRLYFASSLEYVHIVVAASLQVGLRSEWMLVLLRRQVDVLVPFGQVAVCIVAYYYISTQGNHNCWPAGSLVMSS